MNPTKICKLSLIKQTTKKYSTERTRDSLKFARSDSSNASIIGGKGTIGKKDSSGGSSSSSSSSSSSKYEPIASTSSIPYTSSSSINPSSTTPNSTNSTTNLILHPNQLPLPPPHSAYSINKIPFSTHKFVKKLELNGLRRGTSEEIMSFTKEFLIYNDERITKELLSKQDLENEAYLFTAALSELKTEFEIKSRNDGITLKSLTTSLQRDTESLSQRMKEDMGKLTSDIQMDMNQRKEETSLQLKDYDMNIMDLNSKFTISLGELRTEIEATKWISTRRVMSALIVIVVGCIITITTRASSSSSSSSSNEMEMIEGERNGGRRITTIEDLGIRITGKEEDSEEELAGSQGSGGSLNNGRWFWNATPTDRVAGEGEEK